MSDILDKTRRAFVSYLTAGNVGAEVYDAKRSGDKNAPSVVCDANDCHEDPPGVGNFWVVAEVTIRAMAPTDADGIDQKPISDAINAAVLGLLELDNDSLMAALNSQIVGFTVMGFDERKEIEETIDGDSWVLTWRRMIYCGGF